MKCHKVDYEILGDDLQVVEVELDPQETVIAEAGAMNYMDEGIAFEAKLGDGSNPKEGFFEKAFGAGTRMLTGESLFLTHFTNQKGGKKRVSFAAPYPGKILPLNMSRYGNEIICQKDAFLAAAFGTKLSIAFHKRFLTGLFGGEGFILERLNGDGMAFLHGGGTIIRKQITLGQTLRVDTGCLMAFTRGIDYSIGRAGSLKSMLFGGEGLFLATLRGEGIVWLHSLPFSRLAERVLRNAPSMGGHRAGESSLLGRTGKLFEHI